MLSCRRCDLEINPGELIDAYIPPNSPPDTSVLSHISDLDNGEVIRAPSRQAWNLYGC